VSLAKGMRDYEQALFSTLLTHDEFQFAYGLRAILFSVSPTVTEISLESDTEQFLSFIFVFRIFKKLQ
jgi:hypothetical protein